MGTNRDGSPCSAQPRDGGWCLWHAPDLADQRAGWRKRGGANRSNKSRAKKALPEGALSTAEVRGLVGLTIRGVLSGRVEPGIGNSVANLARVALVAAEQEDMEARLAARSRAASVAGRGTG
jgi:hypothetical protein